jgi:hypothetical protein
VKLIAGFDPGKKGALVTYDIESNSIVEVCRVPLEKWTEKHRNKPDTHKSEIDWPVLQREWAAALLFVDHVFIEHVWGAAPAGKGRKDGGASMFKLGYAAGVPFGIILSLGLPHTFVTPQKWHKLLNYPKDVDDPKAPSFKLARKYFPASVKEFARKTVDEGVAEAALLAYAGRLLLEQGNADHS